MQTTNQYRVLAGVSLLVLSALACEPVFAIGWQEFLILVIFIGFLIGPPIYRLFRWLEKVRGKKEK